MSSLSDEHMYVIIRSHKIIHMLNEIIKTVNSHTYGYHLMAMHTTSYLQTAMGRDSHSKL